MKAKITSSRNIFTDGESCVTVSGSHRELLRIAGIQDAPDGCLTLTVRLVVGLGKTLFGGISL